MDIKERLMNMIKPMSRIFKMLFSGILVFFIIRFVIINISSIEISSFKFNFLYLIVSFVFVSLFIFFQYVIWYYITYENKCNLSFSKTIMSRAYSEIGKYIPGKVLGYAMIYYSYSKEDKSKVDITFSMLIELVGTILAALLVFTCTIFLNDSKIFQNYKPLTIAIMLLLFIVANPTIINHILSKIFLILKKEYSKLSISYISIIKIVLLYSINFLLYGLAFIFFIKSITNIDFNYYLFVTGASVGSAILGLLAIFVPAGLGVREGVILVALGLIMPSSSAGLIAITSRIWVTIAELFVLVTLKIVFDINIYQKHK